MTDEPSPELGAVATPAGEAAVAYMRVWALSLAQVLEQISGSPMALDCLPGAPPEAPARGENDWQFLVTAEGGLRGEMGLRIPPAVALGVAQLFLGETQDPTAELKPDHREAVDELLRQVAGYAASALKPRWGEVQLRPQVGAASWPPGASGWIGSATDAPVRIWVEWQVNADLGAALTVTAPSLESPPQAAAEAGGTEPSPSPPPGEQAPMPPGNSQPPPGAGMIEGNLDLLRDVELEVMLRFGERSMLLREILDLGAGSVVELDRTVDQPVDLLLDGRIIARGEVVVVDGNYGLRVLEVQSPPPVG